LEGTAITDEIGERLGIPTIAENDVNLAAVGEATAGVAQGVEDFVFLAVGTGTGLGVFSGGALLRGSSGAAGEISMFPSFSYRRPGQRLRSNELESLTGGEGIVRQYARQRRRHGLPAEADVSVPEIFARAGNGDVAALITVSVEADLLARALLCVIGVLDPELVVIGGGIGRTPFLAGRVWSSLEPALCAPLRFEVTSLGDMGGVVGAVALAARCAAARDTTITVSRGGHLAR
jgi:predicted NBD/HSP70 family sugar kinase